MANSFSGTNTFGDPNRVAEMETRQRVNLGSLQDKGLASVLQQDLGLTSPSSYNKFGVSSLADLNKAAGNYSAVDRTGWLDQYKTAVNPYLAGSSTVNRNVGYAKRDNLDEIESKLSSTAMPEGFTQKQLDDYRFELMDPTGKSLGEKYYGVDDILRNTYRKRLGQVTEAGYVDPNYVKPDDPTAFWNPKYEKTAEQKMWEQFLVGRNAGEYRPTMSVKAGVQGGGGFLPDGSWGYLPEQYDTTPGRKAYQWGNSLYASQDEANAAREAQIMSRPNQYRNLMEKYEAAGEGGMDSQNWKGNYGADNTFSGASAIAQLGGDLNMVVDPKTGQWSVGGYKIDPGELTPEAVRDYGYTQYVEQGKQKKRGGFMGQMIRDLSGGLSVIMPDQFDPSPYAGKRVTEYGGNQLYRDYGDNADEIKELIRRTSGGSLMINEADLAKIPAFQNRNIHDYNTKSQDILIPNMNALQNMTMAGTVADVLFPQFTWGGGAAGAQSMWAELNKEATGQSSGDIAQRGLKNWGKGALTAYLSGVGGDIGAGMGTAGTATATAGKTIGSGLGAAAGSAIGQGLTTGEWGDAAKGFGKGALSSLIGAGLGLGAGSVGLNPALSSAIQRLGRMGASTALSGKTPTNQQTVSMLLGTLLGGLGQYNQSSKYRS